MKPTMVDSGEAAIAAIASASRANDPFMLVLLDANMPAMDGFAVAEKLQAMPEAVGTVVMMLSSSGEYSDAARCRNLGMASFMVKPVSSSELLKEIVQVLSSASQGRRPTAPVWPAADAQAELPEAGQRAAVPLRILLAEDNAVNRQLALTVLERRGHHVTLAHTGREALEALDEVPIDLILMDLQMPEMSGLEATAAIRARERQNGGRVPIVAMTAHAMKGDRERCLEAGMDGYLSKPINRRELVELVEAVAPRESNPPAAATPARGAWSPEAMLGRLGGDEPLARQLAALFLGECPRMMIAIREAVALGSAEDLRRAAHAFKGSVGNFTDGPPMTTAFELEQIGRDNRIAAAPAVLSRLDAEVDALVADLQKFEKEAACAF